MHRGAGRAFCLRSCGRQFVELVKCFKTIDDMAASTNDYADERANTAVKRARIHIGAWLKEGESESTLHQEKKEQNCGKSQDARGLQLLMGKHFHTCQLLSSTLDGTPAETSHSFISADMWVRFVLYACAACHTAACETGFELYIRIRTHDEIPF
jgi:hypothetical protein